MKTLQTGMIMLYKLSETDVDRIRGMTDPWNEVLYRERPRRGNPHEIGQVVPAIVVWPHAGEGQAQTFNGQAILDGECTLWLTSVPRGDKPGQWQWPHDILDGAARSDMSEPVLLTKAPDAS